MVLLFFRHHEKYMKSVWLLSFYFWGQNFTNFFELSDVNHTSAKLIVSYDLYIAIQVNFSEAFCAKLASQMLHVKEFSPQIREQMSGPELHVFTL